MAVSLNVTLSVRGVRSLHPYYFRAPWPFFKKGAYGQRKIGPFKYEKMLWPGQNREFPMLSPKWHKENNEVLRRYTGVQEEGITDPITGEFKLIPEMQNEWIVPDLTGFKLKPYVSFRTDVDIEKRRAEYVAKVQEKGSEALADLYTTEEQRWPPPKMTPETLFELVYGPQVRELYKKGAYDKQAAIEEPKKDSGSA